MSNSAEQNHNIPHNIYFDGKVQSLGLHTESGKATIGVMKPGTYTFSASSPERMVIISGILKIKQIDGSFTSYQAGEEFDVAAGSSFEVSCDADASYICYYG
ncbi:MAG TPA: pyrimidine/purine nucleoside phosphorylase [Pedobacter sp.]|uniref:pyrimidine/purine nucleoside phosphorylase n=1 Tax=Pedobacter sp. TaxID=1411316 RepID=UPI002C5ABD6D|nr:pyrimidine/purine nucleoside phosphorylase [Pedobacter sp.]HMI04955.1 pyrimidine/purine nucleoside phosphorylase [Pedobacter sp.]